MGASASQRQRETDGVDRREGGLRSTSTTEPYTDNRKVRVAGPFTVESLSPHRVLGVDEDDELIDGVAESPGTYGEPQDFGSMILEHLRTAGVQQAHKEDRIAFSSVSPWAGRADSAPRGATPRAAPAPTARAPRSAPASSSGRSSAPSRGRTSSRRPARPPMRALTCSSPAPSTTRRTPPSSTGSGASRSSKARMNADLHMAGDLKNTGKGNLFVIFGEPDIDILDASGDGDAEPGQVKVQGQRRRRVPPQHRQGAERRPGRHRLLGSSTPTTTRRASSSATPTSSARTTRTSALKTTLKAEINEEAWETLHSDTSRPFDKPESGRIAVKVINHLGDEVMKVFRVD